MIKNNSKGITLVSLIATIIIMIIIAGVAIASIVGRNNTIDKAQNAVDKGERISEKTVVETAINKYNSKDFVKKYENGFEGFIEHELDLTNDDCIYIESSDSDCKFYYLTYGTNDPTNELANKYWIIEEDELCRIADIPSNIVAVLEAGKYGGENEKGTWNGEIATKFNKGNGSEKNPYIIENADELALLAKQVNAGEHFKGKYFRIVNDINLNNMEFPCIGYGSTGSRNEMTWNMNVRYFEGTLDGCNHKISNLKINMPEVHGVGLVGVLEKDGVVKNIEISSGELIGRTCIGGLVGASKGNIENCINRANCTAQDMKNEGNSGQMAGGISGWAVGGKIKDCINYGNILTKDDYKNVNRGKCAGGIVGYVYLLDASNLLNIEKCKNYGKVTAKYQLAGGIVGSNEYSENVLKITDCDNYGNVEIPKEWDMDSKLIGGIGGGIIGWIYGPAELKNCSNSGNIKSGYGYCGGIVGEITTGVISECKNSGKICEENSNTRLNGGIAGRQEDGKIKKCINKGNVYGIQQIGGITGKISGGEIVDSKNMGEISNLENIGTASKILAGGIVGYQQLGDIESCENTGKVSVALQESGGITGRIAGGTIKNCSNSGTILAKSEGSKGIAGGIVGDMLNDVLVENVYNSGTVEAVKNAENTDMAGGIVGIQQGGSINKSYNKGRVNGSIIGGIVGKKIQDGVLSKTYYYESNSILGIGNVVDSSGNLLPNQDNLIKDVVNVVEKVTQNIPDYSSFKNWIKNK